MKLSAAALALAGSVLLSDSAASATSAGQCLSAVSAYAQSGQVETDGIVWNDQAAYYHIAFEDDEADEEEDAVEDEAADQDADADEEQKEEGGDRLRRRLQDEEEEQQEEDEEEQAAAEAEATIFDQMQGLAEALGIDLDAANDEAQQEGEEGAEAQQYQDLTYVMAYDEELADALGIEDRDTFAKFYDLTYQLANKGGCSRRLQEDEEEEENDAEEDNNDEDADDAEEDGEGDADEDAAEEMEGDLIENILMNCQDSYEAIGINLEEVKEDGK